MIRASFGHVKGHLKGFTLIELLVVIAIIGILSSVVLASLSTARSKSSDAKVESQLSSARAAAEIYYTSNNNSYGNTGANCAAGMFGNTASGMAGIVAGTNGAVCSSNGTAWAIKAPLVSDANQSWCVDSSGASKLLNAAVGTAVNVCP